MPNRRSIRLLAAAGISLLLAAAPQAGAAPAASRSETPRAIDIPAGTLSAALDKLIDQAGMQIIYAPELARGVKVEALSGTLTFREALDKLLVNSGLTVEVINDRTVVLKRPRSSTSNGAPSDQMRLAQNTGVDQDPSKSAETGDATNQIIVESKRDKAVPFTSANLDLTRTEDDILPFTVFTETDIRVSGAATIEDFLRTRLPQAIQSHTGGQSLVPDSSGTQARNSSLDFRGWGANETVILLNGRRMPAEFMLPSQSDTANATPLLSSIPVASIERIEVLSSAGSAIYGAGATGGVINIITRRDYEGGQVAVNFEAPQGTHAERRGLTFNYGMPLPWGMNLRLAGGYNDSEPSLYGDRASGNADRWRRLAMERDRAKLIASVGGSPLLTNTTFLYGDTPNIHTTSASGGDLFPSAVVSNFTTVPDGYTGTGLTNAQRLAAFQPGVYNTRMPRGSTNSQADRYPLGTASEVKTFSLGVDKRLGELWRWSLDYRYSANEGEGRGTVNMGFNTNSATARNPTVPTNAPTNPFGQAVQVYISDPYMAPDLVNRPKDESWELSTILQGQIGRWRGFFDASLSERTSDYFNQSYIEPYGTYLGQPYSNWYQAFTTGAYNPFVDPRAQAPASQQFYDQYVYSRNWFMSASSTYRAGLKASGPLYDLPAGALEFTAGLDWSHMDRDKAQSLLEYRDSVTGELRLPTTSVPASASALTVNRANIFVFDSYSAYAEANVPLLSAKQAIPLVRHLELFASGRLDRTEREGERVVGTTITPVDYSNDSHLAAYGLRYAPIKGVALRLTRSVGFKPPSVTNVAAILPTGTLTISTDPQRPGASPVTLQATEYDSGGNPELLPESTSSTNVGLILTPVWIPGLHLSVDYLESVRDDAISTLSVAQLLALEADFPERVRRGPAGGGFSAGPVTYVDLRAVNLRQVKARSIDFNLEQRLSGIRGGQMLITALATRNLSRKVQGAATSPLVEQIHDYSDATSAVLFTQAGYSTPKWAANAQFQWSGPRWSFGWNTRFLESVPLPAATSNGLVQDFITLQGSDRIPWKLNHDLNIGYRMPVSSNGRGPDAALSGVSMNFGVKDVFDREPRFFAFSTTGIFPADGFVGRTFWMQMRKDFGGGN